MVKGVAWLGGVAPSRVGAGVSPGKGSARILEPGGVGAVWGADGGREMHSDSDTDPVVSSERLVAADRSQQISSACALPLALISAVRRAPLPKPYP